MRVPDGVTLPCLFPSTVRTQTWLGRNVTWTGEASFTAGTGTGVGAGAGSAGVAGAGEDVAAGAVEELESEQVL